MVRQWTPFFEKCPLFSAFHNFSAKRVAPPPLSMPFSLSISTYKRGMIFLEPHKISVKRANFIS
jgi:hypothetical protein